MEFSDVVRRRRMVRRYADRPVDPAIIDRMLANALHAPSAGFSQGWAFLRLETPQDVATFWATTSPDPDASNPWLDGMRSAPVVIVPLAHEASYRERYREADKRRAGRAEDSGWPIPYWYVDTGMAALLILQTAVDEGVGACFFGIPADRVPAFRDGFGIPDDYDPIGAITVGHRLPDAGTSGSAARRARRTEVVHKGRWQG